MMKCRLEGENVRDRRKFEGEGVGKFSELTKES